MEMLFLFFLIWLPCSIFIGWLASKRGRSGMGWGLLSLLLSPLICLLALLLLSDLKAEATKQSREESRFRDQLAVLSDIKAKMQTTQAAPVPPGKDANDIGTELTTFSRASVVAIAEQRTAAHLDEPQSEALIEPVSMPIDSVQSPAMAADPLLSESQPPTANASNSGAPEFKRKAFNPMAIAVGILIIVVAVLVAYVLQLQETKYSPQIQTSSMKKIDVVTFEVDDQNIKKYNGQWGDKAVLILNINGKSHEGPTDKYLTIEGQGDFNDDGITDALISTNSGGSSSPTEFQFVSIYNGKIITAPVNINQSDFEFMVESGLTVVKTTIGSEIIFWGFDGEKAVKVRSVQLPHKTITSTILCLQNKPRTACPMMWDVIRDDKIFKENLYLILKKYPLSIADINSLFENGATNGFALIKRNGKQYLRTDWHSKSFVSGSPDLDLLVEVTADANGKKNRLTAIYHPDGRGYESKWLNDPTDIEKDILSNPVSNFKQADTVTSKVESNDSSPAEPKRNVWFTPESSFTECIEAQSGPADRIEGAKGKNPSVVEKDGGRVVQVTADYDQDKTVKWMFYRDKAECERVEVNVEKKLADKYR